MSEKKKISVLTSLFHCSKFLEKYFDAVNTITNTDNIEILLLHNEPQPDELDIIERRLPALPFVKHIVIPERENLYATWNRGINISNGDYITVWNVDDLRFPNSIAEQAEALNSHPKAMVAYGDFWISNNYGIPDGRLTSAPTDNTKKDFLKVYHLSCFQMWRREIHNTIGYYDEQLRCIADFDFQIRAALHFPFVKTDTPLGVFLADNPNQISNNGLAPLEYNIIALRSGYFKNLIPHRFVAAMKKYRYRQILSFGKWEPYTEKQQFSLLSKIGGIIFATYRDFRWFIENRLK